MAVSAASSGLSELLNSYLPLWGLEYQRYSLDQSLAGVEPHLLITDCPECLFGLRPAINAPILLVTAYGNFMPGDQVNALAPLLQKARPLSRHTLYETLQHLLQKEDEEHPSVLVSRAPVEHRARILLVEDNPVSYTHLTLPTICSV